jgi:hypothetical protein
VFKKDASHGLSYEKLEYRMDRLHPRLPNTTVYGKNC